MLEPLIEGSFNLYKVLHFYISYGIIGEMEFPHRNHAQDLVDTNIGRPFVAYNVSACGDRENHVLENGGFIDETLRVSEKTRLYIGRTAIEGLLDDRFESFERTGKAEWAIDALTIISLFPEAADQDFSLPGPSDAIVKEVGDATAREIMQPSQTLSDTYDRLVQLESAPEALQRQFYTKLGAYASELTLSHPFLTAYLLFQEEQHGNDFSSALSTLQKRLQQSEE